MRLSLLRLPGCRPRPSPTISHCRCRSGSGAGGRLHHREGVLVDDAGGRRQVLLKVMRSISWPSSVALSSVWLRMSNQNRRLSSGCQNGPSPSSHRLSTKSVGLLVHLFLDHRRQPPFWPGRRRRLADMPGL